jgi:multimeric flavodoxin WrbA
MHVLILSGSRNTGGQTARCANAVAKGLAKNGATSETIFLPTLKIEHCRQCDPDGWGICKREGNCIIQDDFSFLVTKIQSADCVVFTTPVYFSDLCESMRVFLDRLRRITFFQNNTVLRGKAAIGICVAGGGGRGAPSTCFTLENILQTIGFRILEIIPVRRQILDRKVPKLEVIGERLATGSGTRPNAYNMLLAGTIRKVYKAITYLIYVWPGRWGRI